MDEAGDSTFPNWPEFRRLFAYDDLVGKIVAGRYEIVRRLGAGGMGVVFLARHIHLDKSFALKIISPRFMDEPEIGRRFLLEARAASKIDHPNVVSITDFGPPEEGPAFFAMEYLDGEDLAQLLARAGPLPAARVVHIAAQIARALAAAHQRGVIHRDIKPQNCLCIRRDEAGDELVKVLDFGLAKVLSNPGHSAWTVGGSPGYIAPEIYRGGKTDHRVDIFALGVLMYTLSIGRLPAQSPSEVTLPPGAPILQRSDLPGPLRGLIDRATADDPGQRFPTAEALLAALEELRVALARPAARSRRWPLRLASAAAGIALVAGGVVLLADRGEAVEPPRAGPADSPDAPVLADRSTGAADGRVMAAREGPAVPGDSAPVPTDSKPVPADSAPVPGDSEPVPADSKSVPADSATVPGDSAPVPADSAPVPADSPVQPAPTDGRALTPVPGDSPSRPAPRRPPAPFDEAAARALLLRHADEASACKAGSSFGGVATRVRLAGTVTVSARGKGSLALPPGYDINPCLERLVAGLRFRASVDGGSFEHVFLL